MINSQLTTPILEKLGIFLSFWFLPISLCAYHSLQRSAESEHYCLAHLRQTSKKKKTQLLYGSSKSLF